MTIEQQCEDVLNSYRAQGGDFLKMQDLQDLLSMKDKVDFVSSTEHNFEIKNRLITFSQSIDTNRGDAIFLIPICVVGGISLY